MKLDKRYIKFYEIENNRYYLLPFDDEIHIVTESILPIEKKFLCFKRRADLVQGLRLLQLTAPISMLFQEMLNADVDKVDEEFPDMTTYKKVDNLTLRRTIEAMYQHALDESIKVMTDDFEDWLYQVEMDNEDLTKEDLEKIEKTNRVRLEQNINAVKAHSPLNTLSFKWKTGENTIVKKFLNENAELLYSQKIGSNYKIYYLYDLDIFGTVTIYKIHCVKEHIKRIETFIYNREIIQELIACMANNGL